MTNQQEQITLHHVNEYRGGPLAIRSIIYGCPDIRWHLVEDPDSWPITPGLIAWSYNRKEVEILQQQLRPSTNSIHEDLGTIDDEIGVVPINKLLTSTDFIAH